MSTQLGLDLPSSAPPPVKSTARDMLAMLRRHYLPDESRPAGVFAPEIQAPGMSSRRADLIWLGCAMATGGRLVGHEVKVTRADVLSELSDLTKSDPWQRYCDQWYLVVPHLSLVEGLTIPGSWGVMLPPSGRRTRSMTIHREAPLLHPPDQGPALRTIAARQLWDLRDHQDRSARMEKELERVREQVRQLELTVPHNDPRRDVVGRVITALGGSCWSGDRIGGFGHEVGVEDIAVALKDLGSLYDLRDQAQRTLDHVRDGLRRYQKSIGFVLGGEQP